MKQHEADDGFGELGPFLGPVMRWLPMWAVVLFAAMWMLPTAAGLVSSVRPQALGRSSGWWEDLLNASTWTLEPYRVALDAPARNSFAIAILSALVPLLWGSAATYAIVWMPLRGSSLLFVGVVALIAVPLHAALLQLLLAFSTGVHLALPIIDKTVTVVPVVGLAGSIPGVWIVHIGSQLPFSIFLLVFATARPPGSLVESARLDGASQAQIFRRVVAPLISPSLRLSAFCCSCTDGATS